MSSHSARLFARYLELATTLADQLNGVITAMDWQWPEHPANRHRVRDLAGNRDDRSSDTASLPSRTGLARLPAVLPVEMPALLGRIRIGQSPKCKARRTVSVILMHEC